MGCVEGMTSVGRGRSLFDVGVPIVMPGGPSLTLLANAGSGKCTTVGGLPVPPPPPSPPSAGAGRKIEAGLAS